MTNVFQGGILQFDITWVWNLRWGHSTFWNDQSRPQPKGLMIKILTLLYFAPHTNPRSWYWIKLSLEGIFCNASFFDCFWLLIKILTLLSFPSHPFQIQILGQIESLRYFLHFPLLSDKSVLMKCAQRWFWIKGGKWPTQAKAKDWWSEPWRSSIFLHPNIHRLLLAYFEQCIDI